MTHYYSVAQHIFSLTMADDNAIWPLLTNYEPFRIEPPTSDAAVLYSVAVDSVGEPLFHPEEAKHIITDSSDEDMPRIELYEQEGHMLLRVSMYRDAPICTEILCSTDYSLARVAIFGDCGRFPIDNALMLLYAFRTASLSTLEMHASVILKDGMAHLFLGRSGTGKSTHSRQWLAAFPDARLLNDDNPIVRLVPDKEGRLVPYCFGSPWSGKTACYVAESAPIAGIVLLRQCPENKIARLPLPEAYAAVYSSSSGLRCNPGMADGLHEMVASVVTTTPCYLLDCLPNTDAARLCHTTLHP